MPVAERKIGCDRSLPACANCVRTGRQCEGYGIRLQWADKVDGRRKTAVFMPGTQHLRRHVQRRKGPQKYRFLNISGYDVNVAGCLGQILDPTLQSITSARLARPLSPFPQLQQADAWYLSYYEQRIACMISTTSVRNGFRTDLLPMAMASQHEVAMGLQDAMMAVASFHLSGRDAALTYKTRAVHHLARSLAAKSASNDGHATPRTQLATCLMLCVYDVFDEKEGRWRLHMDGARQLFRALSKHKEGCANNDFLMTWFLYHEVFGSMSQTSRSDAMPMPMLVGNENTEYDSNLIIGCVGCSMELLGLIDAIDRIRNAHQLGNEALDPAYRGTAELERLLVVSKQHNSTLDEESCGSSRQAMATAELYRLAGLLYLHQVLPKIEDQHRRGQYVDAAFGLLRSMDVCTSPWPLFIIACEASTDDQRIFLLDMLDRMDKTRNIGNVFSLRNVIENTWKQTDLRSQPAQWWTLFNLENAGPWFI